MRSKWIGCFRHNAFGPHRISQNPEGNRLPGQRVLLVLLYLKGRNVSQNLMINGLFDFTRLLIYGVGSFGRGFKALVHPQPVGWAFLDLLFQFAVQLKGYALNFLFLGARGVWPDEGTKPQ